ncbi:MAG TPA: 50S ribosomal protein L6 [Clostridiales bacterium]|nr:50S ribosomal protein L6 [Clostridiales bacterium]
MSRIGREPVSLPAGVTVTAENGLLTVKGPKGVLTQDYDAANISFEIEPTVAHVKRANDLAPVRAKHGLYRALLKNMVVGVTDGYEKGLTVNGVGWKVSQKGKDLDLSVGFSHNIVFSAPEGITLTAVSPTEISVKGIDKVAVGQVAATIRAIREPEPYHGYGIAYKGEVIERKEGKTAGK